MKSFLKKTVAAAAIALPLSTVFAAQAKAEDTGLINHLNADTRAQVEAYKRAKDNTTPRPSTSTHSGTGSLGIRG